ncbi:putative membrane protein [Litoreibacter ponti]|uniref:Putative membrane protein n=1 Tax=Litoreibacter ponti TaxID=1510457 RepID=A0A2T6BIS4_9RHOB|nr:DUF2177 family protein [Litoreibacter ponti]PTX55970.1 putative membrane protein [Litoreibacter ponti]
MTLSAATIAILYISTFAVFLALDYLGLSYLIKPTFERFIPDLILDSPRLGPALMFYSFYIVGVLWFVSMPAMTGDKSLLWVFGTAAFLGALGYGTYEFTNLSVMKDWNWTMTLTDFFWGIALTGTAATAGVAITRSIG